MEIVIYVIAAVFALLAAALVFTWWRNRHSGALLLAMTYLVAAGLAVMMNEWWPLVLGFLSAWALRLMGMDPGLTQGPRPDDKHAGDAISRGKAE
ncbi:MAG: hypothetical protein RLZZ445_379 [Pseudomonadota bacterium]|jgi:hypothetical protein